jgi:L-alanine-DL-glutamate epimerase-like enolase superfamily enzyme
MRIPFEAGSKSDASAWGNKDPPAADSLLVEMTTDEGLEGWSERGVEVRY